MAEPETDLLFVDDERQVQSGDPLLFRGLTPVLGESVTLRAPGGLPSDFPEAGPGARTPPTAPKAPRSLRLPEFPGFDFQFPGFNFPDEPMPPGPPGGPSFPSGSGGTSWLDWVQTALAAGKPLSDIMRGLRGGGPPDLNLGDTNLQLGGPQADVTGPGGVTFNLFGPEAPPWALDAAGRHSLGLDPSLLTPADQAALDAVGSPWPGLTAGTTPGIPPEFVSPPTPPLEAGATDAGATGAGAGAGGSLSYAPVAGAALATLLGGIQGGPKGAGQAAAKSALPALAATLGGPLAGGIAAIPGAVMYATQKLIDPGPSWGDFANVGYFHPIPGQDNAAVDTRSGAILWYKGGGKYEWAPQTQQGIPASRDQFKDWGILTPRYPDLVNDLVPENLRPALQTLPEGTVVQGNVPALLAQTTWVQDPERGWVPPELATPADLPQSMDIWQPEGR